MATPLQPVPAPTFSRLRSVRRPASFAALLLLLTLPAKAEEAMADHSAFRDPIAVLQQKMERAEADLSFDSERGYLLSLLSNLNIPVSSQVLVFSKTSKQLHIISPKRPRAIYFNDDVYVGVVPHSSFLEISAVDPQLGGVFYTLGQRAESKPRMERTRECLECHESARTDGVPGHLVRSVYPEPGGQPVYQAGTYDTDDRTPLEQRWGGWYVTGTHGAQRHMGNTLLFTERPEDFDHEPGANVTDVSGRFDVTQHLTPHSDIVALMVLGHQVRMHNLIARAHLEAEKALAYQAEMTHLFGETSEHLLASTKRRIEHPAEELLRYMLFAEESPLTDRVTGVSGFAEEFAKRGPFDSEGRSLRQFDLQRRLFRYPCSFLIYSEAFDALPERVKTYVYGRLWAVLHGENAEGFSNLSHEDRENLVAILRETKPEISRYWPPGG